MAAAPVLVGVDGSQESMKALRWAAQYARMSGAPLQVVMAWDLPRNYGMPALYDDVDFAEQAEARLAATLTAGGDLEADVVDRRGGTGSAGVATLSIHRVWGHRVPGRSSDLAAGRGTCDGGPGPTASGPT